MGASWNRKASRQLRVGDSYWGRSHLFTQKGPLSIISSDEKLAPKGGWLFGALLGVGSAGTVLRSQGTWGQARLSRGRAMGIRVSTFQCSLRPGPAPPGVFVGSAGSVLRSLGRRGGRMGFSRCARGEGLIASNARSGPVPLVTCSG